MRLFLKIVSFVVLITGVLVLVFFVVFITSRSIGLTPRGLIPDMGLTGGIGDFIGGVVGTLFSLAATILVVTTLLEQGYQNKRNVFVQSYYEMLRVHTNNVEQMSLAFKNGGQNKGRAVFSQLVKNYNTIYDNLECYVNNILRGGAHGCTDEDKMVAFLSDETKRSTLLMRLAYGYFYYGSEHFHLPRFYESVEETIEATIKRLSLQNQFYTTGYHVFLGHYYRHVFQMIQYIINADCLDEDERYVYAKQLRAQLDDDEQLLLYYNAMADVGKAWTMPDWDISTKSNKMMCPMARFRMIKNIPASAVIRGIDPSVKFRKEIEFYKKESLSFFEQR